MPVNGTEITPALRRAALVKALRLPMPPGHTWDFNTYLDEAGCGTVGCALGVAQLIWPMSGFLEEDEFSHRANQWANEAKIAEWFGLTLGEVTSVFLGPDAYGCPWGSVTARMVADKLESIDR